MDRTRGRWSTSWSWSWTVVVLLVSPAAGWAQRGAVSASVSPSAIGPAAPQPTPIGGLRTTPLGASRGQPLGTGVSAPIGIPWGGTGNWVRIPDAPNPPRGIVVTEPAPMVMGPRFMPTYEKPQWTVDSTAERSVLWRDLIVRDVVCDFAGQCLPRTSRVRARWMARCDCYGFADGLGRVWIVERR